MAAASTPPITLLAGPQLLGLFFNWSLQGVLSVQVYIYYLCFPRDPVAIKYLVYGMLVYEWVQTGLSTAFAFDNYVYGYGNLADLTAFHNTWFSVTIMCSIISAVVQNYFAWRIWILARSRILIGVIVLLSLGQMSVGIVGGSLLKTVHPSAAQASLVTPVIGTWLAGAALVDVVIAVSMTILLLRSKTGMPQSDNVINRLVALVLETGTLTAAVAIADVVLFTSLPSTLLHECPAVVLAKLYANTFLVSLNNRAFMSRPGIVDATPSLVRRLASRSGTSALNSQTQFVATPMHVEVLQETLTDNIALQERKKGDMKSISGDSAAGGDDV